MGEEGRAAVAVTRGIRGKPSSLEVAWRSHRPPAGRLSVGERCRTRVRVTIPLHRLQGKAMQSTIARTKKVTAPCKQVPRLVDVSMDMVQRQFLGRLSTPSHRTRICGCICFFAAFTHWEKACRHFIAFYKPAMLSFVAATMKFWLMFYVIKCQIFLGTFLRGTGRIHHYIWFKTKTDSVLCGKQSN